MNILRKSIFIGALVLTTASHAFSQLSRVEEQEGFKLIFDGKTSKGWRGVYQDRFPEKGWEITNGLLTKIPATGGESAAGGDIITDKQYTNFDLRLEFNLSPGGNSGIKYFVLERQPKPEGSAWGCEFQILDDDKHPDAKMGKSGNRTVSSLYDLIPATNKKPNPPGQWNQARVVVRGKKVEHYLNGDLVVSYERDTPAWRELVAGSKYKDVPNFGENASGHILLQDHGDKVSFRNIRIHELPK